MNIEEKIIDLLEEEFGEGKPKYLKPLSNYKFQGKNVPRVTTIISEMQSNQGLLRYSNYLGFKHMDYKQTLDIAASIGSETHAFIENFIQNGEKNTITKREVINCTNAFMNWWNEININYNVKVLGEEVPLTCPWFGGTYDLLLELNGKKCLVDLKTSKHVTDRYFIQLAAYMYLIKYNCNIDIDAALILRMDKEIGKYEVTSVDLSISEDMHFMNCCRYAFFSQVNNYYSIARVKNIFNKLNRNEDYYIESKV